MKWTDCIVPATILISCGFCAISLTYQIDMLSRIDNGAHHINVSGRQRMLSQRITFLSTLDFSEECVLDASVYLEEDIQDFLVEGENIETFCEKDECKSIANDVWYSLDKLLDHLVSNYTTCGVLDNATTFLYNMENLVESLEIETSEKVEWIQNIIMGIQITTTVFVSIAIIIYSLLTKRSNKKNSDKVNKMIQYLFHEVRNPLNHVVNGIDHILSTDMELRETSRSELEQCSKGGVFITSILNDVLTLASLDSKNYKFDETPSSIRKLIYETAHIASLTGLSESTTVVTDISEDIAGRYDIDEVKLSQVMMNIVTNAVKYAGSHKNVVVGSNVISRGISKDSVCFHVSDNGPGILPETQKYLFDKFRTFSRNSGSGIGLHITQVIVRKMGGTIKVISPLLDGTQGTRFEFTLSLKRSVYDETNDTEKVPYLPKKDVNILIADDERVNCVILDRKFRSDVALELGWTSEYVTTLEEVLQKSMIKEYDIILLDEHFGNHQRGSLFIKTLRDKGVMSKIFIASANCSVADNNLYVKRGAIGTIPKPTPSSEILVRTLGEVL